MEEIKLDKYTLCLTCNIDRYNYLYKAFEASGLNPPRIFPGVHHPYSGSEGCKLGHIGMLMLARCLSLPYLAIYEDDAYPCCDIKNEFSKCINDVNTVDPNWGILVLGRTGEVSGWKDNIERFWSVCRTDVDRNRLRSETIEVSENLISIPRNSCGSHALIVRSHCYNELLHSYIKNKYTDIALAQCNFTKNKVYWTKKLLFCQKQIDHKCMTTLSKNSPVQYLYPYNYNKNYSGVVSVFDKPPIGFVDDLVKK